MKVQQSLEQHIAVFGESGSGKTVLLSSFYGATQEPEFLHSSVYHVVAENTTDGNRLHRNYLGMRDSARVPTQTRFASTSHAFSIKLKNAHPGAKKGLDALRLVWHDYPGEWFEQDAGGPEEAERRIDTFRSLLSSDVALLLVDGQRLIDNAGEEERYLKSLFGNVRNALLRLEDELLDDGRLVAFPRIWMFALSKADLLSEWDVFRFRDLLIEKVGDEIGELRSVLASLVESEEALSVGEDFVLLSSAKFEANQIEVAERIGVDLLLPIAAMMPFERHVLWAEQLQIGAKVADELLQGVGALASAMLGKVKFAKLAGPKALIAGLLAGQAGNAVVKAANGLVGDNLRQKHDDAVANQDLASAALTDLRLRLERGEAERVLLRSLR